MSQDKKEKKTAGRHAKKEPYSQAAVELGGRIKKLRGKKSLTTVEKELKAAGYKISNQALSNLERGIPNPDDPRTQRTLRFLSSYYDGDFGLDWLRNIRGEDKKKGETKAEGRPLEVVPLKGFPAELVIKTPDEIELIIFYRTLTPDQCVMLKQAIGMLESTKGVPVLFPQKKAS